MSNKIYVLLFNIYLFVVDVYSFSARMCTPLSILNSNVSNVLGIEGDHVIVQCDDGYVIDTLRQMFTAECQAEMWLHTKSCARRYKNNITQITNNII